MKVVITGSTGLIGTALVESLRDDGHQVVRLVRRAPSAEDEARWDPANGEVDDEAFKQADAVVHLAGAGIGDKRWNPQYKALIRDSRVEGTTTIAEAVVQHRPRVWVSGSAVGWYGDRGDDVLTESEPNGDGFLADLVRDWEQATMSASDAGVRVVRIRSGIVLSPKGGALAQMLPIFKAGLGGRLASGKQWMPWISLADEVAAIRFAIDNESLFGPVNLSAPQPVTNRELTKSLGRALHRPTFAVAPKFGLRIGLGQFANEGLLASQRAIPQALLDAGFAFSDQTLDAALASLL